LRKILITGGLGFIGLHLSDVLSESLENSIVLVDNLNRGRLDEDARRVVSRPNVTFCKGDLTKKEFVFSLGGGFDYAYHFAAIIGVKNVIENPEKVLSVNAVSTLNLLEWASAGNCKNFLFSSTSEAYAWTFQEYEAVIPTPEDIPLAITDLQNPRASYAGSKIFGELCAMAFGQKFNTKISVVRYHNIYGPRMGFDHVIPQIFKRLKIERENPLTVYSPDNSRAFCYITDALRATIAVQVSKKTENEVINIGNDNEEIKIMDLAERIADICKLSSVGLIGENAENDPVKRRCPDISKLRALTGVTPKIPLDTGLRKTLNWYAKNFASQTS